MTYSCPCCGHEVDLKGKTVNQSLDFITKFAEENGYDQYEQMIKFLAENSIDLAVPSCVKVL